MAVRALLTGGDFRGIIKTTIPARPLYDAQIGGLLFLWGRCAL